MIQFRDIQIQSIPPIPDINHEILDFEPDAKTERFFIFLGWQKVCRRILTKRVDRVNCYIQ